MEEAYRKKLEEALNNHYTPEQVEEFAWHADQDKPDSYRFNYFNHEKKQKNLVYWKETNTVAEYDVGAVVPTRRAHRINGAR